MVGTAAFGGMYLTLVPGHGSAVHGFALVSLALAAAALASAVLAGLSVTRSVS